MIENPIYGGAYAYGKTAVASGYSADGVSVKIRRKARTDWLALMPNAHEGYVSWEKAEAIRTMVSSNVPTSRHHGAPKHGDALLAGLIRCKRCGRKLTLRYSGMKHHIPRSPDVLADFSERENPHWLEGPAWDRRNGYLLFSDVKANAIYRWCCDQGVSLFMQPSGYTGEESFAGEEPGSNGLAFDSQARLLICEHGDRRIRCLEVDGTKTVLADRYQDRRLNSPNDLVCRSNGDIYFTDPPFGLPRQFDDPGRELSFSGVYRLSTSGELTLLLDDLRAPNGIAFSPDEKTLYLADGGQNRAAWLAYAVGDDGTLDHGRVLLDVTGVSGYGGPDGIEVDHLGNVFGAGREAVFVCTADGTLLGSIAMGSITTNLAWGEDGSTLFVTTERRLLRLRLTTHGFGC